MTLLIYVENAVRKSPKKRASDSGSDFHANLRMATNQCVGRVDGSQKLEPKPRSLRFVPCDRLSNFNGCTIAQNERRRAARLVLETFRHSVGLLRSVSAENAGLDFFPRDSSSRVRIGIREAAIELSCEFWRHRERVIWGILRD